jgi:hypothetical protein
MLGFRNHDWSTIINIFSPTQIEKLIIKISWCPELIGDYMWQVKFVAPGNSMNER